MQNYKQEIKYENFGNIVAEALKKIRNSIYKNDWG